MLLPPAADEHLPRAGERNFRAPFLPEFRRRFSRGETEFLNAIPFHLPAPAGCFFLANDARRIEHDGLRDKKENETNELRASRAKSEKKEKKRKRSTATDDIALCGNSFRYGFPFWIFNQESSKRLRNSSKDYSFWSSIKDISAVNLNTSRSLTSKSENWEFEESEPVC